MSSLQQTQLDLTRQEASLSQLGGDLAAWEQVAEPDAYQLVAARIDSLRARWGDLQEKLKLWDYSLKVRSCCSASIIFDLSIGLGAIFYVRDGALRLFTIYCITVYCTCWLFCPDLEEHCIIVAMNDSLNYD